ncbi:hypothetical protein [Arthrobacter sp. PAMC25284]|uniref:hypothetical protein n=1 Tax=Arthrobacter sp. PAMC25284 TaxID=2861279 RepID=UPI001C62B2E4|nr:hypothetical protein [Arthrobacter sp. PAMC25284]QYF89718.1 hypothetical protein KY499_17105 [Arthrobacter sp. PAMC25284]
MSTTHVQPLYTVDDMADIFHVTRTEVYSNVQAWPHTLIGAKVRFTQEHLDSIITLNTKTPRSRCA